MSAPLEGIQVVDFSELLPGPFLTQNMVELGASVIKIERPPHGDNARRLGPGLFTAMNRGKTSVLADLKDEDQRLRVRELVAQADVVVESYRPGILARYGLDYASLALDCPRLVYASLTGYGQTGPDAMLPGHDLNYLAATGALALSGGSDGVPSSSMGLPVADMSGAMMGLSAVLAALYQREKTGAGQYLDVSLTESALHWMNPRLGNFHHAKRHDLAEQRKATLHRPAYGTFRCLDGRYITVGALEDVFWKRLIMVLDLGAFGAAQYESHATRAAHAVAINGALAAAVARYASTDVVRLLQEADVPVMAMVEPSALPAHPQHMARGVLTPTQAGPLCRFPVRLTGMASTPHSACGLNDHSGKK